MKLPKKIISCGVAASLIISVFAAKGIPESKSGDTRFTLPDTTMLESETNRHTMYASPTKTAEKIGTEGYELKLRNNRLQIWFREKTHAIRVEDLKNGHIWGTLESDKPEGMNAKWSAMGNSVCTIDYFNEALSESRISISDRSAEKPSDKSAYLGPYTCPVFPAHILHRSASRQTQQRYDCI